MFRWLRRPQLVRLAGPTMGTTWSVQLVTRSRPADLADLQRRIQACLAEIDACMSAHRPDSELNCFNRHDETPFKMSPELFHVFATARDISRASRGAFDITVGASVIAHGLGPGQFPTTLPSASEIAHIQENLSYELLDLNEPTTTVIKARPDVRCDLSGIAKGYAVDQLAALIESAGDSENFLVEIGGELHAKGNSPHHADWRVAVTIPPEAAATLPQHCVELHDECVATSGDYEVYVVRDDMRLSHTIDPRTGQPLHNHVASVTIICPTCELADAWATALTVLGPQEGRDLAEAHNLAALFITRTPDGSFAETVTSAFNRYLFRGAH